jgi:hypothetical protein
MDEKSLRSLLELAAAEHEPPTAAIVGNSLAAGRRQRRRRRVLGAAGGLAVLGAVAVGVPALAGSVGQPSQDGPALVLPQASGSSPGSASPRASASPVPIPAWWHFVTPAVPAQQLTGDLVPVTAQSAELLLLDELPASATPSVSSQTATTDDAGLVAGQVDVTSPRGSGTVLVSMSAPGAAKVGGCGSPGSGSGPADVVCRDFSLPGDVTVQESLLGMGPSPAGGVDRYLVSVTVQRANGLWVTIEAANYPFDTATESGRSPGVPLSVARIVKAAADPRWARQMPRSFVAQAAGVQLPSPTPKG